MPHFRTLERSHLERLASGCRARKLAAGESLFRRGQPSKAFFAIVSGRVKLHRGSAGGQEQVVQILGPGQSFAEAAVLELGYFPVDATALETPTEVVAIGEAPLMELWKEDERVPRAMVAALATWLHRLVERIQELTVASAEARLAGYLMRLPTRREEERLVVDLPEKKKDLASTLRIAPETLSRLLRRWADRDLIESRKSSVVLLVPKLLLAIAAGQELSR